MSNYSTTKTFNFSKTRNVKSPNRGTPGSAGIDFFVPETEEKIVIHPGVRAKIPSGVRVQIPEGYALIFFNKSGIAAKKGLQVGACVVDEDYQGEVHLHVMNVSLEPQTINPGEKLVQGIFLPIGYFSPEEVPNEFLFEARTNRGSGGFGSTGN